MSYSALNAASFGELLQALSETQYQDFTVNGACSNCGACCSNLLPMTRREIDAIKRYIKSHGIKPQKHFIPARNPVVDMVCPFRDNANRRCVIYDVRPEICRAYRCDKAAHGDFSGEMSGGFADYGLVNVRETFFGG